MERLRFVASFCGTSSRKRPEGGRFSGPAIRSCSASISLWRLCRASSFDKDTLPSNFVPCPALSTYAPTLNLRIHHLQQPAQASSRKVPRLHYPFIQQKGHDSTEIRSPWRGSITSGGPARSSQRQYSNDNTTLDTQRRRRSWLHREAIHGHCRVVEGRVLTHHLHS